jgi:hypothetical protein
VQRQHFPDALKEQPFFIADEQGMEEKMRINQKNEKTERHSFKKDVF